MGEGEIVDCKRALDDLGDLAHLAYASYLMKAIYYVPLGYSSRLVKETTK
jgi:hypothetical protein